MTKFQRPTLRPSTSRLYMMPANFPPDSNFNDLSSSGMAPPPTYRRSWRWRLKTLADIDDSFTSQRLYSGLTYSGRTLRTFKRPMLPIRSAVILYLLKERKKDDLYCYMDIGYVQGRQSRLKTGSARGFEAWNFRVFWGFESKKTGSARALGALASLAPLDIL